jgi:hypothetical protein
MDKVRKGAPLEPARPVLLLVGILSLILYVFGLIWVWFCAAI